MRRWKLKARKNSLILFHGSKNSTFVVKYSRPNKLDELSYQEEVTNSLKNVLKTGNVLFDLIKLPHLLFYGPAGTGKTSAIIALSKELYG